MAISATINKVVLNIADMDRHYYQSHDFTVAQHPSETDFRFMMRMVGFVFNAAEDLQFTKGLCADDEPEIWQKTLIDDITLWIDFGQLDEKRLRKACGRADRVIVYTYNSGKADVWWQQIKGKLHRYKNLTVYHIAIDGDENIASLVNRNMNLQANIQEQELYLSDNNHTFTIRVEQRK